ncbi:MAG: hypothetical protein ACI33K_09290 [Clostridiaceae bacterium]
MKRLRLLRFISLTSALVAGLLLLTSVYYTENIPEIRTPIIIYSSILIIATIACTLFITKINGAFFSIIYFINIASSVIMQYYILNMYISNTSVCRFTINPDSLPLIILAAHCIITMLLGVLNYVVTLIKAE